MLALCQFTTELLGSINGGVHLPSKVPLRIGQGRDNILHRDPLPDDHDVHVAARGFTAGCHGAVDERQPGLDGQCGEAGPQRVGDAESLPDESMQFLEHRALAVGLKVGLPAFDAACEDSGADEPFQLPLDSPGAQSKRADNLPLIETPVGVAEQKAQHGLARGAKERRSDTVRRFAAV